MSGFDNELVPLREARARERFGGKSVNLGAMLRKDLPVPDGYAMSAAFANAVSSGMREAVRHVLAFGDSLGGLWAVRSSALDEDSEAASFAGQLLSVLGVGGGFAMAEAVVAVARSGTAASVKSYRSATGEAGDAAVPIAIQRLLAPESAGVMFTRNPVTGADERVVEAAWGLGEAVVASRVTPDRYRIARGGGLIEQTAGEKSLSLHPLAGGGIETRDEAPAHARALCLSADDAAALDALAAQCEAVFGPDQDIEWAKADGRIYLLQARPITRAG